MRKLELKDIAGYLPYDMMFDFEGNILRMDSIQTFGYKIWAHQKYTKIGKDKTYENYNFLASFNCSGHGFYLGKINPILRPMSDLIKPITVKGYNDDKEFVPMEMLEHLGLLHECRAFEELSYLGKVPMTFSLLVGYCTYTDDELLNTLDMLNQWHFDYRGLIGEGLAIDINKLENEN